MITKYRLSIGFYAGSPEAARKILEKFGEASRIIQLEGGSVSVRLINAERRAAFLECAKWGAVLGVLFVAAALWFIAEGWWPQ